MRKCKENSGIHSIDHIFGLRAAHFDHNENMKDCRFVGDTLYILVLVLHLNLIDIQQDQRSYSLRAYTTVSLAIISIHEIWDTTAY